MSELSPIALSLLLWDGALRIRRIQTHLPHHLALVHDVAGRSALAWHFFYVTSTKIPIYLGQTSDSDGPGAVWNLAAMAYSFCSALSSLGPSPILIPP